MVTYKTPDVYIEERHDAVRLIEGVSTSVAAFIGETQRGPLDAAQRIQNYAEFEKCYGVPSENNYLAMAVQQYFSNGGIHLYIARVNPVSSRPLDARYHAAFALLDSIHEISLIATPGMGTPSMLRYGAAYCAARRDCFFIGEMACLDDTVAAAERFVADVNSDSTYAAVYFPWLIIKHNNTTLAVPPSGTIAGMFARTDRFRGVWKAPAGTDAELHNVVGVTANLNQDQHALLNPIGVNVIRDLPDTGIVVLGARTLGALAAAEWKYIPVRRMAIYIEQSIAQGTDWAVFEPNSNVLWSKLQNAIYAFMYELYRLGAFMGDKPEHAFFVKCDAATNPQITTEPTTVRMQVGFAPLRPAEFIILTIEKLLG